MVGEGKRLINLAAFFIEQEIPQDFDVTYWPYIEYIENGVSDF